MADKTKIEWTDATWNPVTGCTRVSAGCAHCYAETFSERWRGIKGHHFENGFDLTLRPKFLDKPLHWTKPRRIFVNSMSDLFHKDIPDSYIDKVVAVMGLARQHTFQVLTKRPERMHQYFTEHRGELFGRLNEAAREVSGKPHIAILPTQQHGMVPGGLPFPNVWLGTSVENDATAQARIPHLLRTPAAIRFLSCEPLLGPCDITWPCRQQNRVVGSDPLLADYVDWVIVGGESGPGCRPMDAEWARDIRDRCKGNGAAFFMKQMGGSGDKGGALEDLPADLRIREFPR